MKIANIETFLIRLPFKTGAPTEDLGGRAWPTLDNVFVRIDTDAGISGWGDAFGYGAAAATKAAIDHILTPSLIGRDARDIAGISDQLQRDNHIWGRYGITMFAISGIDIALWDIAGKRAGLPLHQMLGGTVRRRIPAYASLFKYRDPDLVAENTSTALAEGYEHVKLHETGVAETRAAREAAGDGVPIMLDTNCPWTPLEARAMARQLADYDLYWLEEPIFPPEDFEALADLQTDCGIPIAAGENACTAFEFKKMLDAEAVTFAQPSVTKVGGITEFRKIMTLAETHNAHVVPHSPYFGPGFLATLHLMAASPVDSLVERFYMEVEASPMGTWIDAENGNFEVPDGPGLGCDPDPDVIRDYADTGN